MNLRHNCPFKQNLKPLTWFLHSSCSASVNSQGTHQKPHHKCKHPWASSRHETPVGIRGRQESRSNQGSMKISWDLRSSKVTCFPCDCLVLCLPLCFHVFLCVSISLLHLHLSFPPSLLPSLPLCLPHPLNFIFLCCSLSGSRTLVNMSTGVTGT